MKNTSLVATLKHNAHIVQDNYDALSIDDATFDNIEVVDYLVTQDIDLHQRYFKAINILADNMPLFKHILDIVDIQPLDDIYATNRVQLAKMILINTAMDDVEPDELTQPHLVEQRLTKYLDQTDRDHNLVSHTFSEYTEILNYYYVVIIDNM